MPRVPLPGSKSSNAIKMLQWNDKIDQTERKGEISDDQSFRRIIGTSKDKSCQHNTSHQSKTQIPGLWHLCGSVLSVDSNASQLPRSEVPSLETFEGKAGLSAVEGCGTTVLLPPMRI